MSGADQHPCQIRQSRKQRQNLLEKRNAFSVHEGRVPEVLRHESELAVFINELRNQDKAVSAFMVDNQMYRVSKLQIEADGCSILLRTFLFGSPYAFES